MNKAIPEDKSIPKHLKNTFEWMIERTTDLAEQGFYYSKANNYTEENEEYSKKIDDIIEIYDWACKLGKYKDNKS